MYNHYALLWSHAGIKILRDQDVFIVGQSETITCTSDLGVSTVEWLGNNGPVFSVFGSSSVIHFDPVNDHDHNTNYTCTTVADFGSQERDIIILAEGQCAYSLHCSFYHYGSYYSHDLVVAKNHGL